MSEERTHAIKVGDILFRLALRILPAEFRTEYGSEIYAFHRARLEEGHGSISASLSCWAYPPSWPVGFQPGRPH